MAKGKKPSTGATLLLPRWRGESESVPPRSLLPRSLLPNEVSGTTIRHLTTCRLHVHRQLKVGKLHLTTVCRLLRRLPCASEALEQRQASAPGRKALRLRRHTTQRI